MNTLTSQHEGLARATSFLRQNNLVGAETACREFLLGNPRHAGATHLLGLIRKEAGDVREGERLMRESIALAPRQAEFRSNLANLLRRAGRNAEAVTNYREALSVSPAHHSAHVGLARALNELGDHAGAEAQSRALLAANERDSTAWSLLAMALRDQLQLSDAEAAYRKAIALAPNDARARHDLGSVLTRMDRAEEAMMTLSRAESLGLKGFELAFSRGLALLQLYRIDEAERCFSEAVQLQPLHAEAHLSLARLRFMCGDPQFTRDIRAAAAAHADDANLQTLLGQILRRAGDCTGAESVLRDLMKRIGPTPDIRTALAEVFLEQGRLKEAEYEAAEAAAERPTDPAVIDVLVTILLCRGCPADALPFIRAQRARFPESQDWIAYEATAARLLRDPLYEEICDYSRLVQSYDLESPPGWSSMAELNAAVLESLNARHRFANHPLDQSLRRGSQTARNLLTDPDPNIRTLLNAFEVAIQEYVNAVGVHATHPLLSRNSGAAKIDCAWSVQLRREGFHVNHVHPKGWISSAYYVSTPSEVSDETLMSGWLKFGEPRYATPGAGPEGVVQPKPGRLVLFPSYMWHGTNPIHGSEPRTTVAFDALPRRK